MNDEEVLTGRSGSVVILLYLSSCSAIELVVSR